MSKVVITSAAEWEFTEALGWYADRSVRAAENFDSEFNAALKVIATDPRRFPLCDDRHRFYLINRFPYQVIYREQGDVVAIIAVAHAKQRPGYWSGR